MFAGCSALMRSFAMGSMLAVTAAVPAIGQSLDKARGAIAGYTEIVALPMVCDYRIDDRIDVATMSNLKALAPIAKLPPGASDEILKLTIFEMVMNKERFCGKNGRELDAMIAGIGKAAFEMAQGTGATLTALPAPEKTSKTTRDLALENMNLAIMLETISDECGIKLEGKDSLAIDRVQYYWRGVAGASAKEFQESQRFWAKDVKAAKERLCAANAGFRKQFDDILKTIQ
jgi:hypothetical protein